LRTTNCLRAYKPFGQFQSGPTLSSATASSSQVLIQRCSMRFGASNRRLIRMTGTGIRTRRPCDIAFSPSIAVGRRNVGAPGADRAGPGRLARLLACHDGLAEKVRFQLLSLQQESWHPDRIFRPTAVPFSKQGPLPDVIFGKRSIPQSRKRFWSPTGSGNVLV
jgi:hypothetical protein